MLGLLKYNWKVYIRNNRFIIPLIIFCIFQFIYYSPVNVKYEPSVTFCANVSFCIMAWIGFTYCLYQDSRTEEIIFLKVQNQKKYWLSKIIFMLLIVFATALLGTGWAVIRSVGNITITQGTYGFVIQFLSGALGLLVGMILQVKVTGNKNISIIFIFIVALISVIKIPIVLEYSFVKYILWVFPPVSDLTFACINQEYFTMELLLYPILISILYIVFEVIIYYKIMKKILF